MWKEPKVDWVASDYFNFTDYTRIIENIEILKENADQVYTGISKLSVMETKTSYDDIPYADNWNAIEHNVHIINNAVLNLNIGEELAFYDNGYTPNFEVFNKWEHTSAVLNVHILTQLRSMARLEITLGGAKPFASR